MRRRCKPVDRALRALVDPSAEVRRAAVELVERRLRVLGPRRHPRRQIDQAFVALTMALRRDPDEGVRLAIAYALTSWFGRRAAWALLPALLDASEAPCVRGQAAEGIGNQLHCLPLDSDRQAHVVAALAAGLRDAAPEVRFWCLYAVGQMQLRHLRPEIERLRDSDASLCPRMWYVHDEAADVLAFFDTGIWPERDFVREA